MEIGQGCNFTFVLLSRTLNCKRFCQLGTWQKHEEGPINMLTTSIKVQNLGFKFMFKTLFEKFYVHHLRSKDGAYVSTWHRYRATEMCKRCAVLKAAVLQNILKNH